MPELTHTARADQPARNRDFGFRLSTDKKEDFGFHLSTDKKEDEGWRGRGKNETDKREAGKGGTEGLRMIKLRKININLYAKTCILSFLVVILSSRVM